MRLVDFIFAMPFIVVALVASVVWGPSLGLVIILLVLFTWAPFARQVRAETLQLKTTDYVALARVAGASGFSHRFSTHTPRAVQHRHGSFVPPGRLAHPDRVGSELPRDWDSPAGPVVGHDGVRGASIHIHGLVDVLLPWGCHPADRLLHELLRRLASRPAGPEAETDLGRGVPALLDQRLGLRVRPRRPRRQVQRIPRRARDAARVATRPLRDRQSSSAGRHARPQTGRATTTTTG